MAMRAARGVFVVVVVVVVVVVGMIMRIAVIVGTRRAGLRRLLAMILAASATSVAMRLGFQSQRGFGLGRAAIAAVAVSPMLMRVARLAVTRRA